MYISYCTVQWVVCTFMSSGIRPVTYRVFGDFGPVWNCPSIHSQSGYATICKNNRMFYPLFWRGVGQMFLDQQILTHLHVSFILGTTWICIIYGYQNCKRRIYLVSKENQNVHTISWSSFVLLFKWTSITGIHKINSVISLRNNFQIMVRAREHPNTDRASDLVTYLGTCSLGDESISHCCLLQKNCDRMFYILGSGAFLGPVLSNPFQIQ